LFSKEEIVILNREFVKEELERSEM